MSRESLGWDMPQDRANSWHCSAPTRGFSNIDPAQNQMDQAVPCAAQLQPPMAAPT